MSPWQENYGRRWFLTTMFAFSLSAMAWPVRAQPKLALRDIVRLLFNSTKEQPASLVGHDLSGLNLAELDFKNADLRKCNLFGVDLTDANLAKCNLEGANLDRSLLIRTNLSFANLSGASIRRPSVFTNYFFDPRDLPILTGVNLSGAMFTARLSGADFSRSNLTEARFIEESERDLGGAPTSGLRGCNFTDAVMERVHFSGLDLAFSDFQRADLTEADFTKANLMRADFTDARVDGARFENADLSGVIGLALKR